MMESLVTAVVKWAKDRNLIEGSTPLAQFEKTEEEVTELFDGIVKHDKLEIKDAIGDITVTLIIQAEMHGISFNDCLASAYDEIKDRKGQMINGKFVKEADLELSRH